MRHLKDRLNGKVTAIVFLFLWFSVFLILQANPSEGSISGVVVESRKNTEDEQTLLVEVRGEEDARADEIRLKLPKSTLKKASAGKLPSQWQLTTDKNFIKMSGAGLKLPLYFRVDLEDSLPPIKTDVEVYYQGKRKFRQKGVIIKPRPPVRISDDFTSVLKFPPIISPGDYLELKPFDIKLTPLAGTWKIGGEPAEFVEEKQHYRFTLPADLSYKLPLSLSYSDPYGEDLYYTPGLPDIKIISLPVDTTPTFTGVSPIVFVGDLICICGYFPDENSRYGFRSDSRDLGTPVSSSSHVLVYRLPDDIEPGVHHISPPPGTGFESDAAKEIEVIRVRGSIDRNKLLRGESTPLHLRIEGTQKVLNVSLTNKSPKIISLDGGNEQVIPTSGGEDNKIEKMVQGIAPGDFNLRYKLDLTFCPCYEDMLKESIEEDTEYFENLFDDAFNDFRKGREAANDAANQQDDNLESAKLKAKEALELLSRARKKVEQGVENGDIGPTAAESFRRFISQYETQAQRVLDTEEEKELIVTAPPEPISSRPEEKPHAEVTDGWLAPSQGVWQDDDVFKDFEGKKLTKTGPGQWQAELKMVVGRPTLIFGIREDGRNRIKIMGTTNGTRLTKVKFRFKLIQGSTEKILYTEPSANNHVALDGVPGATQPFAASIMAHRGLPEFRSFTIDNAGSYRIEGELLRENGQETGLKIAVTGEAIQTYGPTVRVVPAILSSSNPAGWNQQLTTKVQTLATEGERNIPLFFPVAPGGMTVSAEPLQDLRSLEPGTLSKIKSILPFTDTIEEVRADALSAAVAQRFGTDAAMGGGAKVMVLLSDHDFDLTRRGGTAAAYCASQKFMVGRHDINFESLAHELVHSMPYLWSKDQMVQNFGINYHNAADNQYGDGVEIHRFFRILKKRIHAVMGSAYIGKWITQGTYWHLLNEFRSRPDPELLLVRGYIARDNQNTGGYFIPFYRLMGVADLEALSETQKSNWKIVVKNDSGVEMARFPIYARWKVVDLDIERNILSFTYRVPFSPGIHRIELVGPGGLLDSKVISANAPSVKITSPASSSKVVPMKGKVNIKWSGSDPDNDVLSYSVYYSPDNGKKWRLVSMDQQAGSLVLSIPGRPKKVRVKVVASDGFRSHFDEVGFSIKSAPTR